MIPQFPFAQHPIGPAALASAQLLAKAVQKRIEIVIVDDEQPPVRTAAIVLLQVPGDLQPDSRLAGAFLPKHDRRRRLVRIAVNLVPGGVKRALDAVLLEHQVRLRVLLSERIASHSVMFQELMNLHGGGSLTSAAQSPR